MKLNNLASTSPLKRRALGAFVCVAVIWSVYGCYYCVERIKDRKLQKKGS